MKHSCPSCDLEVSFSDIQEVGICPECGLHFSEDKKRMAFDALHPSPPADVSGATFFLWFIHLTAPPAIGIFAGSFGTQFDFPLGISCGFFAVVVTTGILRFRLRNSKRPALAAALAAVLGIVVTGVSVFAGCTASIFRTH